jgi:hypothetical protein
MLQRSLTYTIGEKEMETPFMKTESFTIDGWSTFLEELSTVPRVLGRL